MKLTILVVASIVLAVLVGYSLAVGPVAPLWLALPALAFAAAVGASIVLRQWLPVVVLGLLRAMFVGFGVVLVALGAIALADARSSHWILVPILATAIIALLVGVTHVPPPTPTPVSRGA